MPVPPISKLACQGRLTLTSGTPVTTSDVTAATTVYFTPFDGNVVHLYSGAAWVPYRFSEVSVAVPATTTTMYDVFLYDSSGTLTLDATAWTNDTTRTTAVTLQNGRYVKSGATGRLYLGSFRTTGVSGQCEDSDTYRGVWNNYNQVVRRFYVFDDTNSWTYATTSFRSWNNSTANRIEFMSPLGNSIVNVMFSAMFLPEADSAGVGLGLDSTTTSTGTQGVSLPKVITTDAGGYVLFRDTVSTGYHYLQMLERGGTSAVFYGDNGSSSTDRTYMSSLLGHMLA